MKWLCFGAGAIGTYIGGSLALSGETVVFIEQERILAQLREQGLRLDMRANRRRGVRIPLAIAPSALIFTGSLREGLRHGPFDAGLYALKSYDTASAAEVMKPLARRMPPLVCFSNGVENEGLLSRVLGGDKVIPATVTSSVGRRGPGDIVLERLRGIGIQSTHAISGQVLASAGRAGLRPRGYEDGLAMKWSKMLTNLIANPTSAMLDMTASEVMNDPGVYSLEMLMLRECLAVMRAKGIPVVDLPGTPVRALAWAAQLPPWLSRPLLSRAAGSGRGGKMPSFHIDLHSGRGRSEVDYLHGAVARAGREAGVPTPVNEFLTESLLKMTRGELSLDTYARKPERLLAALRDQA